MALTESQQAQLQKFFNQSFFPEEGAVITDLDGTAIHEREGRYLIPQSVELGLKSIYDLGRPVVLNTLRFPYSVMRTFGKEWYSISNSPIPTVLMNGSQLGYIVTDSKGEFAYEEIAAFVLTQKEIEEVLKTIALLVEEHVENLLVFYYPRNWQMGEIIWTPVKERVSHVRQKYLSAAEVITGGVEVITAELVKQEICMIFMLVDLPHDKLMAYQHTKKNNFFTHEGVNKRFGAEQIAGALGFDLKHSLGAGDSEMDTFLTAVGQAVHVGNPFLSYESILPPIKLQGSSELGDLLFQLAGMQRTVIQ
jgi:hydroxymethylpyrimidine pyrophosphatase-like HAD family hydrolase